MLSFDSIEDDYVSGKIRAIDQLNFRGCQFFFSIFTSNFPYEKKSVCNGCARKYAGSRLQRVRLLRAPSYKGLFSWN